MLLLALQSSLDTAGTGLLSSPFFDPAVKPIGAAETGDEAVNIAVSIWDIINTYSVIFAVAFLTTLLVTPLARRLALRAGVVDRPDEARKIHRRATPYFGGIAVLAGLIVAIAVSYVYRLQSTFHFEPVPLSVALGMLLIAMTGLADDIWGLDPRLKIAGQLIAAAALAIQNIGVKVAAGLLFPVAKFLDPILGSHNLAFAVPLPGGGHFTLDLVYWAGTAIIAIFVLGGCNAANLIDGLDGLLSGVVAIIAAGLLTICLLMALTKVGQGIGTLTGARLVLTCALLGAVLGFLPHNFNPATIFLGDCGSLLLGYMCVVVILMLGEHGQTHLVLAGLIIFSVPIMDTSLAIVRRRLSGQSMSSADDQHIHHQLKRALGGVKRAVFALYGISVAFALLGVSLAALTMVEGIRLRVVYVVAMVLFSFIGVITLKAARAKKLQAEVEEVDPDRPEPDSRPPAGKPASKPLISGPAPPIPATIHPKRAQSPGA